MKILIKFCFYLVLCLIMVACTQKESGGIPVAITKATDIFLPSVTATIQSADSIQATLVLSSWPPPTVSFNTTPLAVTSTSLTQSPTPLPDFEPTEIPGLLQSALHVETLSSFNGHSLQRISGWEYGFYSLEWLDKNHLLLYPFVGVTNAVTDRTVAGTYPTVINLDSEKFWIPYLNREIIDGRAKFSWSAQLGVLIIPGPNNEVFLYDSDGTSKESYSGHLLGVSPSATKILIDNTWIDLSNGKKVDFSWNQTGMAAEYAAYAQFRPIWSPDETRVYACCYAFGDARTGMSFVMPFDDVTLDGEKTDFDFLALHGKWILNGKYVMPWGGLFEGPTLSVYLFDPAAKTFRDLSVTLGLPHGIANGNIPYCNKPLAPDGGRYAWVERQDGSYLIDFATFRSKTYPHFGKLYEDSVYATEEDVDWSADGNYARMSGNGSILSAVTQELKPSPEDCSIHEWHPKDNVLLCMSSDGQKLLLVDAKTVSVLRETTLPGKFSMMGWSPNGKHFALLANDNSSWQINYPKLDDLEQLTSAMPELTSKTYNIPLIKNTIWSADNNAIAFIGAQNIYIVQTDSKP